MRGQVEMIMIVIMMMIVMMMLTPPRICGQVFDSVTNPFNPTLEARPVYSYSKPFNIYVHTDSTEGSGSPPESLNRYDILL